MPYQVKKIDLGTVVTSAAEVALADYGRVINEIFVLDIPLGNSFGLKIGRNSDYITITRPFSMEPRGKQESNEGLSYINPVAQPGVIVEVVIGYGADAQLNPVI